MGSLNPTIALWHCHENAACLVCKGSNYLVTFIFNFLYLSPDYLEYISIGLVWEAPIKEFLGKAPKSHQHFFRAGSGVIIIRGLPFPALTPDSTFYR